MPDNDARALAEAATVVGEIDARYRSATIDEKEDLKARRDEAFSAYSRARLALLEGGVLATDEDLQTLRDIGREVREAAQTQALIVAIGRFAGLLLRFAA